MTAFVTNISAGLSTIKLCHLKIKKRYTDSKPGKFVADKTIMFPAVKQIPGCHRFKRGLEVETVVTWWLITQDRETFSVFVPFLRTFCLQDFPILRHQTPLCEAR